MRILTTVALLAVLGPTATGAAAPAAMEQLQPPAWLVRDGDTRVLRPDERLQAGDTIRTGARARLRIGLAEGSDVKMGSNARAEIPRLAAPESAGGVFELVADIARGAFRFTTGEVGSDRKRDVEISVGQVTAGIRGTDIWGKATPERDFIVLLEGEIEAQSGDTQARLDQPRTAFIQPRDDQPKPQARLPQAKIQRFAKQTEPVPERGILGPDGDWRVLLDSLQDQARARSARGRYREAGYPVDLATVEVDGQRWHRLELSGAISEQAATALARELEGEFNVREAWTRKITE